MRHAHTNTRACTQAHPHREVCSHADARTHTETHHKGPAGQGFAGELRRGKGPPGSGPAADGWPGPGVGWPPGGGWDGGARLCAPRPTRPSEHDPDPGTETP